MKKKVNENDRDWLNDDKFINGLLSIIMGVPMTKSLDTELKQLALEVIDMVDNLPYYSNASKQLLCDFIRNKIL